MMSAEDMTEQEIIRSCLKGDGDRYSVLVERYKDMAFNIACRILGDPDAAKDMAQESFIAAYSSLKEFRQESKFSSWLCRILVNKCKDYLRAGKKMVPLDETCEAMPSAGRSPEQNVCARQSGIVIQKALGSLPLEYREVVVLKHIEELDYNEISSILGASVNALKVRAHRGREMLRQLLENRGVGV